MRPLGPGEHLRRESDHCHDDRGNERLPDGATSRANAISGEHAQISSRNVGLDRVRLRAEDVSQPLFDVPLFEVPLFEVRHRAPRSPA